MVAHGRNRNVPITASVENVTVPGDAVHWGDTVRVLSEGMGGGKHYANIKTFPNYGSGGLPYADRDDFKGDAESGELEFTIGASRSGAVNNGTYPTDGSIPPCYVWLDKNADLSDGYAVAVAFLVLAPR